MLMSPQTLSARIVFYRQFLSSRANWRNFLLFRLVDPAIFFFGISLGLGHFISNINGYDYRSFLLPGSICLTLMFSGLFEGSFNAFSRAYMQRTWFAYLATPTRLRDILAGELAWCAVRSLVSVTLLILVGLIAGAHINILGTILALPFIILTLCALMSVGYLFMSFARNMNDFDILWALVATPMMVFSGVMVDFNTFPTLVKVIGWCLPLTHALEIIRPLMLGYASAPQVLLHATVLLLITVVAITLAHRRITRKIFA